MFIPIPIHLFTAIGDRLIEVIGLENVLYVGQIIAGVRQHGLRLAQCSSITIRFVAKRVASLQFLREIYPIPKLHCLEVPYERIQNIDQ